MNLEQIDTSTTAGKAEVMRLAAEGRKVALRGRYSDLPWGEMEPGDEALWNWGGTDYAIISEPVGPEEVWLVVVKDMSSVGREGAEEYAARYGGTVVRYLRADLAGEKG